MVNYNYFRILINFNLLLYLSSVHKIRFTTDHFYLLSNFALSNSINYGLGIIHSQVTIFINFMSWYGKKKTLIFILIRYIVFHVMEIAQVE